MCEEESMLPPPRTLFPLSCLSSLLSGPPGCQTYILHGRVLICSGEQVSYLYLTLKTLDGLSHNLCLLPSVLGRAVLKRLGRTRSRKYLPGMVLSVDNLVMVQMKLDPAILNFSCTNVHLPFSSYL